MPLLTIETCHCWYRMLAQMAGNPGLGLVGNDPAA